jgi:hypothetical protein
MIGDTVGEMLNADPARETNENYPQSALGELQE